MLVFGESYVKNEYEAPKNPSTLVVLFALDRVLLVQHDADTGPENRTVRLHEVRPNPPPTDERRSRPRSVFRSSLTVAGTYHRLRSSRR